MTFQVTVGPKTRDHPYFGQGSTFGFLINGVSGAPLTLQRGQTYTFNIQTPGHPFYITTSSTGNQGGIGDIGAFPPTQRGTVKWTIPSDLEWHLYYQCTVHPNMGSQITLSNLNTKKNLQETSRNNIQLETIIEGLTSPVAMASSSQDPNGLYIAEQTGLIYRYDEMTHDLEIYADLREHLVTLRPDYDERGLLGVVFSPDGSYLYAFLSMKDNRNVVLEINVNTKDASTILTIPTTEKFHNGGGLAFGPDNSLYIGIGDGGPQADPYNKAQNDRDIHGKIHRYDPRTSNTTIYAKGIRNPWGLSFDDRGRFFLADVGYNSREEINIVTPGFNGGWNYREGTMLTPWSSNKSKLPYDKPIYEYAHPTEGNTPGIDMAPESAVQKGTSAVIGGYYLDNIGYVFGDYSGNISIVQEHQGKWSRVHSQTIPDFVKAFGKKGHDIYVLTSEESGPSGNSGKVSRLVFS